MVDKEGNSSAKKKILTFAGIIGATAAIGGAIYALFRGKSSKLSEIKFDKGIATLKDSGQKFSGKIKDKLKNGDKVTLEYVDGILQKSTKKGSKTLEKTYSVVNGEKIVKNVQNGTTKEVNITKINNEVKNSQEKLNNIIKNNSSLSLDDFKTQVKDIKYTNKNQKVEIDKIIADKQKAIVEQQIYKKTNKQLSEVTFENGLAKFNGEPYSGKVYHTLPNGDKVVLEYNTLGELKKSEVSGSRNFVKEYDAIGNIKITESDSKRVVNPRNMARNTMSRLEYEKEALDRLNSILKEDDYDKVTKFLNDETNNFSLSKLSDEQLQQVKDLQEKLFQKNNMNQF